eukprot:scaffold7393_cov165-Skeletonema_marinoi.AAC.3
MCELTELGTLMLQRPPQEQHTFQQCPRVADENVSLAVELAEVLEYTLAVRLTSVQMPRVTI